MESVVISVKAALLFVSLLQSIAAQHPIIAVVGYAENVNNSTIQVDDNESLEMNCSTANLPPETRIFSYQWLFTNAVIPGANAIVNSEMPSSLLRIRSLSYFHHLGNYTCIVTTFTGQQLHSPVLTVSAKYVSVHPANTDNTVLVAHNQPAILKCIVVLPTNVRNAHIRWFQGSLALTDKLPVESNTYYRIENATEENDGRYSCEVTSDSSGRAYGYFTLKVISLPLPPTNITLHPHSAGAVNVSWLTDPNNTNTSYTLTVSATHHPSVVQHIHQITDTFYIFTPTGSPCEEFEFQVTARNDVGISSPSEAVTAHLPLLPVHAVESSLQHSVVKSGAGGVSVSFTHQILCEDNITIYAIHLQSDHGGLNSTSQHSQQDDRITYSLDSSHGIQDDTRYEYYISVTNKFGEVNTQEKTLYTSDVQSVCGLLKETEEGTEVTILCIFAEGSNALGCMISLITDTINITMSITRDSSSAVSAAGKITVNTSGLINSYYLHAQDIEVDGSISPLYLQGNLSSKIAICNSSQQHLSDAGDVTDASDNGSYTIAVTASVLAVVCIVLVVGMITTISFVYYWKGKKFVVDHAEISTKENPAYSSISGGIQQTSATESKSTETDSPYHVYATISDI